MTDNMKYLLLLAILTFTISSEASYGKGFSFDNGLFRYEMSFDGNRIMAVSWKNHRTGEERLRSSSVPYFEFMTDKGMLTSDMPVWKYLGTSESKLSNGSVVYTFEFQGKGKAAGITLCLDSQFYPDVCMVRERLRIRQNGGKRFSFANLDGKNHFVYPAYSFTGECNDVMEVRMATFDKDVTDYSGVTYDNRNSKNLRNCHMFHVDSLVYNLCERGEVSCKGPFAIVSSGNEKIISTYEHASQDLAILRFDACGAGIAKKPADDDYWYIATTVNADSDGPCIKGEIRRGGYLDGENIPESEWYETVWFTTGIIGPETDPAEYVRDYLTYRITDCKGARRMDFYYNTWGLQRDASYEKSELRRIFNEKRILAEIDRAAGLGVDLFVFDDGWQKTMGVWEPDSSKLSSGLSPLIARIKEHGMIPGAWISLAGIDSLSQRCIEHHEWIIKDDSGKPIRAQYKHPALDLVSDCIEELKKDHIKLIDAGIRFFKWDAINTFHSYQPGLHHGGEEYSRQERIDRYNYLLPFYVTRLMKELKEYEPEVEIEVDLTEPERALVGLMPLQYGKFFWMNNGASNYGDYSTYRGKSMRRIVYSNFRWLPSEIFTYASYPHDIQPYYAQRYNVNTSLLAGRGFWGNLSRMKGAQIKYVGRMVAKSKKVLKWIEGKPMNMYGTIGSSPEIYWQLDPDSAFGQVFAFSGTECTHSFSLDVDSGDLLGVLNHAYATEGGRLSFDFAFSMPDDTREAFILGNEGKGVTVTSASGWLDDMILDDKLLEIHAGASGTMKVAVPEPDAVTVTGAEEYEIKDDGLVIRYTEGAIIRICW